MAYVHGYAERESERLNDQAGALVELLHHDTAYPAGSRVLEAGCGVGAQTITLAANSPEAQITSIEISPQSLAVARERVTAPNVTFEQADLFSFRAEPFDHIFVCFVLEHLRDPYAALRRLRTLLRPGGTITVIEGDHGSAYFHPESDAANDAIDCLIKLQSGDAKIGRRLYPLVSEAGFGSVRVSPRMVYVDASKPELVDAFTLKTFTAMIEGVREPALAGGLIDADRFDRGIADLAATETFSYTFFKAVADRD
ncbi:methyltransferase domain-containing protein [Solirubrobacter sp. CPCC 204708]|uniref:Methyltransferase domain-containing protein n=1 Tax=Solirubrobacter deserti TaxID=2282478 RepID=A0ABT4REB3_9ACTN|nr:methyltransferase [Solirubrobacter deserti]MBE2316112.1 methyltransferase domain-containing protein [Solirubrobacter deserti]MDA0136862.1 methyltransferase domain-containing protein [Solirubrobacter deserti]